MDKETKKEFGKVSTEFVKVRAEFGKVNAEFGKVYTEFDKVYAEFDKVYARLDKLLDNVVTRVEFDMFKEDLFERMATRQQMDDHMTLMDWAVREAKKARDEQDIFSYRFVGLDDKVEIHERRITKLEKANVSG